MCLFPGVLRCCAVELALVLSSERPVCFFLSPVLAPRPCEPRSHRRFCPAALLRRQLELKVRRVIPADEREEEAFRMWINSLDLVLNLGESARRQRRTRPASTAPPEYRCPVSRPAVAAVARVLAPVCCCHAASLV